MDRPDERKTWQPEEGAEGRGVYIISVAAELVGVHPQTLRIYERRGLLSPSRTSGNTRRYSERDIRRLQMIQRLTQDGVSLAGVHMILDMETQLEDMRRRMREMRTEMERMRRRALEEVERVRRERRAEMVPLSEVRRLTAPMRVVRGQEPRRGPIAVGPAGSSRGG